MLSKSSEGASDWLHHSLSYLDQMSTHIVCGLHLFRPHECNCGEMVESKGKHGLKCNKVIGRKMRHKEVNKLLNHGLDQVKFPSVLEPVGLFSEVAATMASLPAKNLPWRYLIY